MNIWNRLSESAGLRPSNTWPTSWKDPASDEECPGPDPTRCNAGPGREFRGEEERADSDRRDEGERHVEQKVVRENAPRNRCERVTPSPKDTQLIGMRIAKMIAGTR